MKQGGRLGGASATYTKSCPRPPERGRCTWRKNLKQGRRLGGALKGVPGSGFKEGRYEGGSISGASFCICGGGERSEPRPHIQRLARGLRRGGNVKGEKI